jgi:predicted transcriptional regulator
MKKLMVDGHPGLYRDVESGAIINDNLYEYESYMKSYQNRKDKFDKINQIENDLHDLKSEMTQIKNLLLELNERSTSH